MSRPIRAGYRISPARYNELFMGVMEGKAALVLGVANKWSLAWAIARAFVREGARLALTYQGDRQKSKVEELGSELSSETLVLPCDVTVPQQLSSLVDTLRGRFERIDCA